MDIKLVTNKKNKEINTKNKKRLKIGIDIDEVVTEYIVELLSYLEKTRNKKINYEDIFNYDLKEIFNMNSKEVGNLIKEHTKDDVIYNLDLVDKAKESLDKLKEKHNIFFITSRHLDNKQATFYFFKKHFPEHNFKIIFSSDAWENGNKSKAEICEDLGIDIFIEDNPNYVLDCAKKGVKCFLFNKPWNKCFNEKIHNINIKRVYNWDDILDEIEDFSLKNNQRFNNN